MAKKKPEVTEKVDPLLAQLADQAQAVRYPPSEDPLALKYPDIWKLICPSVVYVPNEEGVPKAAVREPFISIQWSAAAGGWTISVSDKLWKTRLTWNVRDLTNLWAEMAEAWEAKRVVVTPVKKKGSVK
jgi:hypothetical protein